jgi:putative colanic acid biosynthesis UDP-glucose lipid carrier transferase
MYVWMKSIDPPGLALLPVTRVLAAFCLVFFAPVLLAVAVLVKCGSSGPIFSKLNARGVNGNPITVWKFRTAPASPLDGRTPSAEAARYTGLGAFLRDTRLEGLPRLLNMLRGDMPFGMLLD